MTTLSRLTFLAVFVPACPSTSQPTTTWHCTFSAMSSYIGGDELVLEPRRFVVSPAALELRFIDTGERAFVLGNNGSSEVQRVPVQPAGMQFVERTGTGALQVTAIDVHGNATHSRHTQLSLAKGRMLMAAQYYGSCTKIE